MKMEKSTIFLIVMTIAAIILFVIVACTGCEFDSPCARYAQDICIYNVENQNVDNSRLDDNGIVIEASADLAVGLYMADGTLIDVGGCQLENPENEATYYNDGHWYNTEKAGIRSNFITQDGGWCRVSCWCQKWTGVDWYTSTGFKVKGRHTSIAISGANFKNLLDPRYYGKLLPFYFYGNIINPNTGLPSLYYGGFYSSGSLENENIPEELVRPATNTTVRNLSAEDDEFLANESLSCTRGFSVYAENWCRRCGDCGDGFFKQVSHLFPIPITDPNIITYCSTPYVMSLQVILAEALPTEAETLEIPATLSVEPDFSESASCRIAAISDDRQRIILIIDYTVPVYAEDYCETYRHTPVYERWDSGNGACLHAPDGCDPNDVDYLNIYKPAVCQERYVKAVIVPMENGQRIHVELDLDASMIEIGAAYWLTDYPSLDMNGDGIVNFSDGLF